MSLLRLSLFIGGWLMIAKQGCRKPVEENAGSGSKKREKNVPKEVKERRMAQQPGQMFLLLSFLQCGTGMTYDPKLSGHQNLIAVRSHGELRANSR